jgi:hypothetical protein
MKNIILNILKIGQSKFVKFGAMMYICIFFTVTFFGGNLLTGFFLNHIFNTRVVSQGIIPPFSNFDCFAHDYLQTGYSYVLDIS